MSEGSQRDGDGSMELAIEVETTECACSQVRRPNLYLQRIVFAASEISDRISQCS